MSVYENWYTRMYQDWYLVCFWKLNMYNMITYQFLSTFWLFNIAMENGSFTDGFPAKNLHL